MSSVFCLLSYVAMAELIKNLICVVCMCLCLCIQAENPFASLGWFLIHYQHPLKKSQVQFFFPPFELIDYL